MTHDAANARQRAYRRSLRPVVDITDLPCYCWCEAEIIHVPRETVLQGRTESCGREGCAA